MNIMDISKLSSSHFISISDPQTISKRQQEEKPGEDERVVAKSKKGVNLVSKTINQSPTVLSSSTAQKSVKLKAQSSNLDLTSAGKRVARGLNEIIASSSQDVNPNTGTGVLVANTTKSSVGTKMFNHNLEMSPNNVDNLESRQTHDRSLVAHRTTKMGQIDVNVMSWKFFNVRDNGGGGMFWTRLSRNSTYYQEHGL